MWEQNKHLIFLSEKRLSNPVFQSASLISVSNFPITSKMRLRKPTLSDVMATYHEAVIGCIKKDKKPESIRRLIFNYNLFCKKKLLLNGRELREASAKVKLNELDMMIKELCNSK